MGREPQRAWDCLAQWQPWPSGYGRVLEDPGLTSPHPKALVAPVSCWAPGPQDACALGLPEPLRSPGGWADSLKPAYHPSTPQGLSREGRGGRPGSHQQGQEGIRGQGALPEPWTAERCPWLKLLFTGIGWSNSVPKGVTGAWQRNHESPQCQQQQEATGALGLERQREGTVTRGWLGKLTHRTWGLSHRDTALPPQHHSQGAGEGEWARAGSG